MFFLFVCFFVVVFFFGGGGEVKIHFLQPLRIQKAIALLSYFQNSKRIFSGIEITLNKTGEHLFHFQKQG